MDLISKRIDLIKNHLNSSPFPPYQGKDNSLEIFRSNSPKINKEVLYEEYLGERHDYYTRVRNILKDLKEFNHFELQFLNKQEKYVRILLQVLSVQQACKVNYEADLKQAMDKLHCNRIAAEYDITLHGRIGVFLGLYVDTIQNLGTEKHVKLRELAYSLKHYGCFALTELGHGSNLGELETTATYVHKTREFIINSPTRTSVKWWIGAAAKTANMAVVWAQLIVDGVNKGLQAFAVEIRDYETHKTKPGVILGDCGNKIALEGIDNGFLIFNNYRVHYDCLLDFYSHINEEGSFKSSIKNKEKRLGIMLGGLLRGRIGVVVASEATLRNALTIALRYATVRKQFGEKDQPEKPIISYQLYKYRLMPLLSKLFALDAGIIYISKVYNRVYPTVRENPESEELVEFHSFLSCLKVMSSNYSFNGIQECRESCGGLGFSAHSGLGRLRNTTDILLTWEGDNNVLLQQTGKYILKQVQKSFKGVKSHSETLPFLNITQEMPEWPFKSENDITINALIHLFE